MHRRPGARAAAAARRRGGGASERHTGSPVLQPRPPPRLPPLPLQSHAGDVADFEAVLQLYARALADTAAGVAKAGAGGGGASETLQGVCSSIQAELRAEMQAKAADLDAAVEGTRGGAGGLLRKAWSAVVGSLRDSVFRGEGSRLAAVTARLRARLPELCAALQVETLGRVTAGFAELSSLSAGQQALAEEQRSTTALLKVRACL